MNNYTQEEFLNTSSKVGLLATATSLIFLEVLFERRKKLHYRNKKKVKKEVKAVSYEKFMEQCNFAITMLEADEEEYYVNALHNQKQTYEKLWSFWSRKECDELIQRYINENLEEQREIAYILSAEFKTVEDDDDEFECIPT